MNNLLDVRKMEEGKMQLVSAPLSLESVVNKVFLMHLLSVRPGVSFFTKIDVKGKDWARNITTIA